MKLKRHLGIDLGTSNSAVSEYQDKHCNILSIRQATAPQVEGDYPTLPSALYLAPDGSKIIGAMARDMAAKQPQRTIVSPKSWLCQKQASPRDRILPWESPLEDIKVSPVEASINILTQLRSHTNFPDQAPNWDETAVTLTVPASFDETARQLTLQAAGEAGLKNVSLLEEPLAALYSWISHEDSSWKTQVAAGDLILVCDIGGGTSDFSLVAVTDEQGLLNLERIAVGRHLLLGGDNMDLALAFRAKVSLEEQGASLSHSQFAALVYQATKAKESLMKEPDLASVKVAIASQGSDLFASALTVDIQQTWIQDIVLEGFFPTCTVADRPEIQSTVGLKELGLQYESDPAISRHLAAFLGMAADNVCSDSRLKELAGKHLSAKQDFLKPTAVLFNGGVFQASTLRSRVLDLLASWCQQPPKELMGTDYHLAVAKGASYFTYLKESKSSLRIRSGTAHSFYLGVAAGGLPIPGYTPPTKGICLVPQGTEEGTHLRLDQKLFALKAGEDVQFKFYSTPDRAGDKLGDVIPDADRLLQKQFVLSAHIPRHEDDEDSYPVWLDAEIDDMGTMLLRMQHTQSSKSWHLEFDVRHHD